MRDFSVDLDFAAAENLDYTTRSTETDLKAFSVVVFFTF